MGALGSGKRPRNEITAQRSLTGNARKQILHRFFHTLSLILNYAEVSDPLKRLSCRNADLTLSLPPLRRVSAPAVDAIQQ